MYAVTCYHQLYTRVSHIWGNRRCQTNRRAMEGPLSEALLIVDHLLPGKYDLGNVLTILTYGLSKHFNEVTGLTHSSIHSAFVCLRFSTADSLRRISTEQPDSQIANRQSRYLPHTAEFAPERMGCSAGLVMAQVSLVCSRFGRNWQRVLDWAPCMWLATGHYSFNPVGCIISMRPGKSVPDWRRGIFALERCLYAC